MNELKAWTRRHGRSLVQVAREMGYRNPVPVYQVSRGAAMPSWEFIGRFYAAYVHEASLYAMPVHHTHAILEWMVRGVGK